MYKTVLYVGVTNDLSNRVWQHQNEPKGFVSRYNCNQLIYFEKHSNIRHAIDREKQIKRWSRKKKELLIKELNPNWRFYSLDEL